MGEFQWVISMVIFKHIYGYLQWLWHLCQLLEITIYLYAVTYKVWIELLLKWWWQCDLTQKIKHISCQIELMNLVKGTNLCVSIWIKWTCLEKNNYSKLTDKTIIIYSRVTGWTTIFGSLPYSFINTWGAVTPILGFLCTFVNWTHFVRFISM